VTNRQLTQQQQQPAHLKEAETIEELELMDEEDEFEGVTTTALGIYNNVIIMLETQNLNVSK
jgi:hypothetical protein